MGVYRLQEKAGTFVEDWPMDEQEHQSRWRNGPPDRRRPEDATSDHSRSIRSLRQTTKAGACPECGGKGKQPDAAVRKSAAPPVLPAGSTRPADVAVRQWGGHFDGTTADPTTDASGASGPTAAAVRTTLAPSGSSAATDAIESVRSVIPIAHESPGPDHPAERKRQHGWLWTGGSELLSG